MYSNKNKAIDAIVTGMVIIGLVALMFVFYGCGLATLQTTITIITTLLIFIIIGILLFRWVWKNRNNL